jgi:hypothetical protein
MSQDEDEKLKYQHGGAASKHHPHIVQETNKTKTGEKQQ